MKSTLKSFVVAERNDITGVYENRKQFSSLELAKSYLATQLTDLNGQSPEDYLIDNLTEISGSEFELSKGQNNFIITAF